MPNANITKNGITFTDNSKQVLSTMENSIKKALTALGQAIVEVTVDYMQKKYGKPIYLTGDLIRSISFDVDLAGQKVIVGSNLEYAQWVHNGTARMPARPFLRDAMLDNVEIWNEIVQEYLGAGFSVSVSMAG